MCSRHLRADDRLLAVPANGPGQSLVCSGLLAPSPQSRRRAARARPRAVVAGAASGGTVSNSGAGSRAEGARDSGVRGRTRGAGGGGSGGTAGGGTDLSAELYDPAKLPRFDIDLPAGVDRCAEPGVRTGRSAARTIYVTATLRYGARRCRDIGLRIKGEASFRKLDEKPPFKLKFDEFVDDQTFRGLKRLTLNNMVEDPSFLAERMAYDVFRAAELPAPRCNSALVYVNGRLLRRLRERRSRGQDRSSRAGSPATTATCTKRGRTTSCRAPETAFDLETNETANDRTDLAQLDRRGRQPRTPRPSSTDIGTVARHRALPALHRRRGRGEPVGHVRVHGLLSEQLSHLPRPDLEQVRVLAVGHGHVDEAVIATRASRTSASSSSRASGDTRDGAITAGLIFQRCLREPELRTAYRAAVEKVIEAYESAELETLAEATTSRSPTTSRPIRARSTPRQSSSRVSRACSRPSASARTPCAPDLAE